MRWDKLLAVSAEEAALASGNGSGSGSADGQDAPRKGALRRNPAASPASFFASINPLILFPQSYELDHLGNPKNVSEPLREILIKDRITVTKVVYDDDEDVEPIVDKMRKAKGAKAASKTST